jgi:hypothetical protein
MVLINVLENELLLRKEKYMTIFLGIVFAICCLFWIYYLIRLIIDWSKKDYYSDYFIKMMIACIAINITNL